MEKKLEFFFKQHKLTPQAENARSYIFDCPACSGKQKIGRAHV